MNRHLTSTQLVITGTSFISAVALGYLASSKRFKGKRKQTLNHFIEAADWINTKRKVAVRQSLNQLHQLNNSIQQHMRHHIPDLYEATEYIDLNTAELWDA